MQQKFQQVSIRQGTSFSGHMQQTTLGKGPGHLLWSVENTLQQSAYWQDIDIRHPPPIDGQRLQWLDRVCPHQHGKLNCYHQSH